MFVNLTTKEELLQSPFEVDRDVTIVTSNHGKSANHIINLTCKPRFDFLKTPLPTQKVQLGQNWPHLEYCYHQPKTGYFIRLLTQNKCIYDFIQMANFYGSNIKSNPL